MGRFGRYLLWVTAVGLGTAGLFPADPVGTAPEQATTTGALHNLGGLLGIAAPVGAALVSVALARILEG